MGTVSSSGGENFAYYNFALIYNNGKIRKKDNKKYNYMKYLKVKSIGYFNTYFF